MISRSILLLAWLGCFIQAQESNNVPAIPSIGGIRIGPNCSMDSDLVKLYGAGYVFKSNNSEIIRSYVNKEKSFVLTYFVDSKKRVYWAIISFELSNLKNPTNPKEIINPDNYANPKISNDIELGKIKLNMTFNEVVNILGKPGQILTDEDMYRLMGSKPLNSKPSTRKTVKYRPFSKSNNRYEDTWECSLSFNNDKITELEVMYNNEQR